ncbi:MAG TPA: DUF4870 domain-containing protein [Myxococcaceae bacterium]|jgi:uncharacterized Tic20 family protein
MLAELPEIQPMDSTPSASGDDRVLGIAAHVSSLVLPLLGPAIVYAVAVARSTAATACGRQHAATALNFHLTMALVIPAALIGHSVSVLGATVLAAGPGDLMSLMLATTGSFLGWFALLAGFGLFELTCMALGCVAAARGRPFTYPLAIPLFH